MGVTFTVKRPDRRQIILAVIVSSLIISFPYLCLRANITTYRPWIPFQKLRPALNVDSKRYEEQTVESTKTDPTLTGLCNERLGNGYIENFIPTATNYCDEDSTTRLTCFHNKVHIQTDSFCIGDLAFFDNETKRFSLDCKLRSLTTSEVETGTPLLGSFPQYWYDTGPSYIFSQFFNIGRSRSGTRRSTQSSEGSEGVKILIKREFSNDNYWHSLMEVMSLSLSLNVLRQATNPDTGKPFWSVEEAKKSQIVFLDDAPRGPYDDLWEMFTGIPSSHLSGFSHSSDTDIDAAAGDDHNDMQILVPLPGSANPMWQGQWADMHCGQSPLLKGFSDRVLDYYNITTHHSIKSSRVKRRPVMTFADRRSTRQLINQTLYVAELRRQYPNIDIQVVDFGALRLQEQLQIAHATDILVGPHGAGLTQAFFLPPGSTLVEILPPEVDIKAFDLTAQALGHRYLRGFGKVGYRNEKSTGQWHNDDILIEQDDFMELMREAIAGVAEGNET